MTSTIQYNPNNLKAAVSRMIAGNSESTRPATITLPVASSSVGISTRRAATTPRGLSAKAICSLLKALHDACWYASRGIPVNIEMDELVSRLNDSGDAVKHSIPTYSKRLCKMIRGLSAKMAKNLRKLIQDEFDVTLQQYMNKIKIHYEALRTFEFGPDPVIPLPEVTTQVDRIQQVQREVLQAKYENQARAVLDLIQKQDVQDEAKQEPVVEVKEVDGETVTYIPGLSLFKRMRSFVNWKLMYYGYKRFKLQQETYQSLVLPPAPRIRPVPVPVQEDSSDGELIEVVKVKAKPVRSGGRSQEKMDAWNKKHNPEAIKPEITKEMQELLVNPKTVKPKKVRKSKKVKELEPFHEATPPPPPAPVATVVPEHNEFDSDFDPMRDEEDEKMVELVTPQVPDVEPVRLTTNYEIMPVRQGPAMQEEKSEIAELNFQIALNHNPEKLNEAKNSVGFEEQTPNFPATPTPPDPVDLNDSVEFPAVSPPVRPLKRVRFANPVSNLKFRNRVSKTDFKLKGAGEKKDPEPDPDADGSMVACGSPGYQVSSLVEVAMFPDELEEEMRKRHQENFGKSEENNCRRLKRLQSRSKRRHQKIDRSLQPLAPVDPEPHVPVSPEPVLSCVMITDRRSIMQYIFIHYTNMIPDIANIMVEDALEMEKLETLNIKYEQLLQYSLNLYETKQSYRYYTRWWERVQKDMSIGWTDYNTVNRLLDKKLKAQRYEFNIQFKNYRARSPRSRRHLHSLHGIKPFNGFQDTWVVRYEPVPSKVPAKMEAAAEPVLERTFKDDEDDSKIVNLALVGGMRRRGIRDPSTGRFSIREALQRPLEEGREVRFSEEEEPQLVVPVSPAPVQLGFTDINQQIIQADAASRFQPAPRLLDPTVPDWMQPQDISSQPMSPSPLVPLSPPPFVPMVFGPPGTPESLVPLSPPRFRMPGLRLPMLQAPFVPPVPPGYIPPVVVPLPVAPILPGARPLAPPPILPPGMLRNPIPPGPLPGFGPEHDEMKRDDVRQWDRDTTNQFYHPSLLQRARDPMAAEPFRTDIQDIHLYTLYLYARRQQRLPVVTFSFDFSDHAPQLGQNVRDHFRDSIQGADQYIRYVLNRNVQVWQFLVRYETDDGEFIVSRQFRNAYQDALGDILDLIEDILRRYRDRNFQITQWNVRLVPTNAPLIIGGLAIELSRLKIHLDEQFGKIKDEWYIVNPRSKSNCLWTSVAVCCGYRGRPELIYDVKKQNEAGKKLKYKVGTENKKAGMLEDIDELAKYKKLNIEVMDQFGEIIHTGDAGVQDAGVIKILNMYGHYHALLPKDEITNKYYKEDLIPIERCEPIQKLDEGRIKPLRRIVSYDLESYKKVLKLDNGKEMEIEQIAYAIAWAFECRSEAEILKAEDRGYEIHSYMWKDTGYDMAYKVLTGDECLDGALDEWLTFELFHDAVFYAHNGGKFDIRLILGQSQLLHKSNYVLDGERTIELNGRLINMVIGNKDIEYPGEKKVENHMIYVRDSLVMFGPDSSLGKLTAELDVPHKKMEELVDVHLLQYADTWYDNWQRYDLGKYLKHDVLGLLEVLIAFNKEVTEGTGIPITSFVTGASLSKKYFLKEFYKPEYTLESGKTVKDPSRMVYHMTPEFDRFIRDGGYGGGRCENFVSCEVNEKVYYYDFTSLYPDVGRRPMPVGKPRFLVDLGTEAEQESKDRVHETFQKRILNRELGNTVMFWKVRVRSPMAAEALPMDPLMYKPLFGIKENGMYAFRWFAEWTDLVIYEPELMYALEEGLDYEIEPVNGVIFNTDPLLRDCMESLFTKKAEAKAQGNNGLSKTWKIIANSLYGVWGLRTLDREGIEIARPENSSWALDMATEKLLDIKNIGEYIVTRRLHDLPIKDCNVAIAAAVTSEARLKLYRLMRDIQRHGGKILYCDTDSIITTLCIEENPVLRDKWKGPSDGKDLGSLKNEIDECYDKIYKKNPELKHTVSRKYHFDKAVIVAPKLYIVSAEQGQIVKKAHKGYRENPEKGDVVTYERMKKLVDRTVPKADRYMEQETLQWLGGNGDLMKGEIGVKQVVRTKQIRRTVNKGKLQGRTGEIVPLINPKPQRL